MDESTPGSNWRCLRSFPKPAGTRRLDMFPLGMF
jgi:hypothetical protein